MSKVNRRERGAWAVVEALMEAKEGAGGEEIYLNNHIVYLYAVALPWGLARLSAEKVGKVALISGSLKSGALDGGENSVGVICVLPLFST